MQQQLKATGNFLTLPTKTSSVETEYEGEISFLIDGMDSGVRAALYHCRDALSPFERRTIFEDCPDLEIELYIRSPFKAVPASDIALRLGRLANFAEETKTKIAEKIASGDVKHLWCDEDVGPTVHTDVVKASITERRIFPSQESRDIFFKNWEPTYTEMCASLPHGYRLSHDKPTPQTLDITLKGPWADSRGLVTSVTAQPHYLSLSDPILKQLAL